MTDLARTTMKLGALSALAFVTLPGAAGAQTGAATRGLFGIAPAKRIITARPPVSLSPIQLTNTTQLTFKVNIFVAPLVQAVDGGLTFDASPAGLKTGASIMSIDRQSLEMGPDSRIEVHPRWLRLLPGLRAAPMAVVFRGVPLSKTGQQLKNIYRLAAITLMQLPGKIGISGDFTGLRTEQGPQRTLVFTPTVKNTGQTFSTPQRGHVTILDAAQKPVARGDFKGVLLLPGASHDFPVVIRKLLPAGHYTAVASMRFGPGAPPHIEKPFILTGPNLLPTEAAEFKNLSTYGEAGGPGKVDVTIVNTGNLPINGVLNGSIIRLSSSIPATKASAAVHLKAGQSIRQHLELGHLELAARYRVDLVLRAAGRDLVKGTGTIEPSPHRSLWKRFTDFLRHNWWWISLLVLLLLVALVVRRERRLRREIARARAGAEPAAATPAPAGASSSGRVNINDAGVAELQRLPGVGPKAAERIVAHREEFGRFDSVDALSAVEGFGAKRVEALRGAVDT